MRGLRFAALDPVLDLATGTRGAVEHGDRDPRTGFERYSVRLVDGRVVWRTDKELEPAPLAGAHR